MDGPRVDAISLCRFDGSDSPCITGATATFGFESQPRHLVLEWLFCWPFKRPQLLPLVDFRPMTGLSLPADQATMRVCTSREPEDPEFTVGSILPFLGLGATDCDLNHYVLPMQTSVKTYVCPALESKIHTGFTCLYAIGNSSCRCAIMHARTHKSTLVRSSGQQNPDLRGAPLFAPHRS